MLEEIRIKNRRFMEGLTLRESPSLFEISEGILDGKSIPTGSFELVYDNEVEVSHDLFIVEVNDNYEYRLQITYLDGVNMSVYEGEEKLFHRFLTVITNPDGSYSGDIVYIDELVREEPLNDDSPYS